MPAVRTRLMRSAVALLVAAAPAAAQQKPTLTPADYAQWERLGSATISHDGEWLAYVVTRVDDNDELRIRELATDSTRVVTFGTRPVFSADGRWLAYAIGVSDSERERLRKAGEPARSSLGLLDLRTGAATVVENVAGFEFSGDGRFIAMRGYAPKNGGAPGVDVVVRDLATGLDTNFGNVAASRWQDEGALLAMVIAAQNRAGNGVRLYDARAGIIRTLVADTAEFTGLTWRSDADDLAVLRVREDDAYEEPTHTILAWRGVAGASPIAATFDASARRQFPADHRVVDTRALRWSRDGGTLYFGIREWTPKPDGEAADTAGAADDPPSEVAGVEVWHARDVEIIPEQKVREGIEKNRSHVAAWHLDDDAFVQLGSELTEDVSVSDGRFALGRDATPYERERMFGPAYRDLYAIDMETGERTRVAERVQFQYGISPGGRYILYVRDGDYRTHDTRTGRDTNITAGVPATFVNLESDLTVEEKPPFGHGGWTTDDASVLLYDRYDIWEVRPDGTGATNLTHGAEDRVRHRRVWLNPDDRIVDMSEPVYVALYGERTKKYGYARLRPGAAAERLVFVDANVSRLGRAEDADVFYYSMQRFDDSPDFFVGGPDLADARQVTRTNPFQDEFAWGRSELIRYRNAEGRDLQAALLYPANYDPARSYPMIVYFYEITSNTIHNYSVPSELSAYNPTVFTQNGYFVLRPDIVYRARDPGVSAVETLEAAVAKAVETAAIDTARIGLIGHSWGGYQTAFAVTQTDMFSAAVAGAPLTNLISMYLSIYWNSGGTDARIFEISQGRMAVPFWHDVEAYIRNSPVFHIENMNTPLLVAFGDEDGAVEFNQGIELYNAARRAGKEMVLLVYEGENHSLSRKPNQRDYHRRINEWFAHYLKGEPAPEWITSGVSHRNRQRELDRLRSGGDR